jgi:hypothetical protein
MRSQPTVLALLALAAPLAGACWKQNTPDSPATSAIGAIGSPDLSLRGVTFARTADGRVTARGTAAHLDYRRAGGQLNAEVTAMTVVPQTGSNLSSFGLLHFAAPHATGEVAARHGNAWGGVRFTATRGDRGSTESIEYDGNLIHGEQPVDHAGPGYTMHGHGMVLHTDGSSLALNHGVTGTLQSEVR